MRAFCGYGFWTHYRLPRPQVCGLALGLRARMLNVAPEPDALPVPGAFIVIDHPENFDATHWLPGKNGGFGVSHLALSSNYGTLMQAEWSKEAPVTEEEDAHGVLAKAVIGTQRQSMTLRVRLRARSTVETGDAVTCAGVTWYVTGVVQVWAEGEWAEMQLAVRRWPSLARLKEYAAAGLS